MEMRQNCAEAGGFFRCPSKTRALDARKFATDQVKKEGGLWLS
jgi:hypothetical protein